MSLSKKLAPVVVALLATHLEAQPPPPKGPASRTQVVLLGTGTPPADPDRSGPATAVVVNGTPYLVDFGRRRRAAREGGGRRQGNQPRWSRPTCASSS